MQSVTDSSVFISFQCNSDIFSFFILCISFDSFSLTVTVFLLEFFYLFLSYFVLPLNHLAPSCDCFLVDVIVFPIYFSVISSTDRAFAHFVERQKMLMKESPENETETFVNSARFPISWPFPARRLFPSGGSKLFSEGGPSLSSTTHSQRATYLGILNKTSLRTKDFRFPRKVLQ